MVRYKIVKGNRNVFRKETFKSKKDARDAIYFTNKGARALGQTSAVKGARIVLIRRRR